MDAGEGGTKEKAPYPADRFSRFCAGTCILIIARTTVSERAQPRGQPGGVGWMFRGGAETAMTSLLPCARAFRSCSSAPANHQLHFPCRSGPSKSRLKAELVALIKGVQLPSSLANVLLRGHQIQCLCLDCHQRCRVDARRMELSTDAPLVIILLLAFPLRLCRQIK